MTPTPEQVKAALLEMVASTRHLTGHKQVSLSNDAYETIRALLQAPQQTDNVRVVQIDKMNDGTCHLYVCISTGILDSGTIIKLGSFNPNKDGVARYLFSLKEKGKSIQYEV